ncbi:MAG: hypothetical protein AAFV95_22230 [Bacteroidota bacterium]
MSKALAVGLLTLFCFCFSMGTTQAQDNYDQALGLRGGPTAAVTYKRFLDVFTAIEGIAGFNFTNGRIITLTGLYQYHQPISYQANLYGGAGLTMGFNSSEFRLNLETMVGIEYTMPKFPLNISFDYKPAFNIFKSNFIWNEFGVSVRYTY